MTDPVQLTIEAHVAHVTLNRPDKLNALDASMFEAIIDAGETVRGNGDVRAVVLSGAGNAFCAGLDKSNFANMLASQGGGQSMLDALLPRTHGLANVFQQVALIWRLLPVPVIAAIHGACFGGGLQIALGADLRYARADARLSIREIMWGLIPDMAGTQLIQGLAREDVMRELTYTGREFSGKDAAGYGIVTRVCEDPLTEALGVAAEIAQKNPTAIEAAKRVFNAAPYADLKAGMMSESLEQETVLKSENFREALSAALKRRPPKFGNAR